MRLINKTEDTTTEATTAAQLQEKLQHFNADAEGRFAVTETDRATLNDILSLAAQWHEDTLLSTRADGGSADRDAAAVRQQVEDYVAITVGAEQRQFGSTVINVPSLESESVRKMLRTMGHAILQEISRVEFERAATKARNASRELDQEKALIAAIESDPILEHLVVGLHLWDAEQVVLGTTIALQATDYRISSTHRGKSLPVGTDVIKVYRRAMARMASSTAA